MVKLICRRLQVKLQYKISSMHWFVIAIRSHATNENENGRYRLHIDWILFAKNGDKIKKKTMTNTAWDVINEDGVAVTVVTRHWLWRPTNPPAKVRWEFKSKQHKKKRRKTKIFYFHCQTSSSHGQLLLFVKIRAKPKVLCFRLQTKIKKKSVALVADLCFVVVVSFEYNDSIASFIDKSLQGILFIVSTVSPSTRKSLFFSPQTYSRTECSFYKERIRSKANYPQRRIIIYGFFLLCKT